MEHLLVDDGYGIVKIESDSDNSGKGTGHGTSNASSSHATNAALAVAAAAAAGLMNGSTTGSSASTPKRLCLVCGDQASGFHYGVASCEACKAFFKRTIQGNIEYTCPANSDCEINKRRRKACQACRFHKCLRMGMLKEGVRLDRVRGGRQKYRRAPDSGNSHGSGPYHMVEVTSKDNSPARLLPFKLSASHNNNNSDNGNNGHYGSGGGPSSGGHDSVHEGNHGGGGHVKRSLNSSSHHSSKRQAIEDNILLNSLMECEPDFAHAKIKIEPDAYALVNNNNNNNNIIKRIKSTKSVGGSNSDSGDEALDERTDSFVRELSDLMDKELVSIIGFAKQIPGFTDLLLNDQMRLLQSAWGELLSLTVAYRSQHLIAQNELKLIVNKEFVIDEEWALDCNMRPLFLELLVLTRRVVQLDLAREEYLLLKALILTNSDVQLENEERALHLRDLAQSSLGDAVSSLYSPASAAASRLSSLLLALPLVRQLDTTMRAYWSAVRLEGRIPMNKLFMEMLDSKTTSCLVLEDKIHKSYSPNSVANGVGKGIDL